MKLNLIGMKFGRLLVIEQIGKNGSNLQWKCLCDCGNESIVIGTKLKQGHTQSCGCFQREQASKAKKTHGLSETKTYKIWEGMRARCNSSRQILNKYYGNIFVCKEWDNFEQFLADMGERPEGHSIERVNNKDGYSKLNCKWATQKQQCNNTSRNRKITYEGVEYNLTQLATNNYMNSKTLWKRLKDGWSVERAIKEPVRKNAS